MPRQKSTPACDVIGWQIGDGAENILKLIIAREIFGKDILLR